MDEQRRKFCRSCGTKLVKNRRAMGVCSGCIFSGGDSLPSVKPYGYSRTKPWEKTYGPADPFDVSEILNGE